ncbi:MAG: TIGR02147 family protein [Halobacteriovoraceae bacterium]|jgi:uncharacterized protein (TIGR02147 family)|nr:TIGR02147 family protein [Halobacteriovoraceae bacterium]MBT5094297.1 TIGR02147 family protein [Halobacteriovoraceae bacterium]
MTLFECQNYKEFVLDWIQRRPKKGHGQFLKISQYLGVHSSMISHIFKGDKEVSLEHAVLLADFFGLSEFETQYFVTLVQFSRAGSQTLKDLYLKQIVALRKDSKKIEKRVIKDKSMNDGEKARFYSSWQYSAVRLATSLDQIKQIEDLSQYFQIEHHKLNQILQFLLSTGLCVEKKGQLEMGPSLTHIGGDSPMINTHHTNWRKKAFEAYESSEQENLFYTLPMSVGVEESAVMREMTMDFIQRMVKVLRPSKEEKLMCLGIDFFNFR